MSTIYSRINYGVCKKKAHVSTPALFFRGSSIRCPQAKALVIERRIVTPRKPNSALRKCVKVMLMNYKYLIPYIRGGDHNLRKFSESLLSGGGARDLPGVSYSCIRGVRGLMPVPNKTKRRTIYGGKQPLKLKKRMRRKYKKVLRS